MKRTEIYHINVLRILSNSAAKPFEAVKQYIENQELYKRKKKE